MTEDPNAGLSRQEYWDERYSSKESDEAHYDWLRKFETVKPFLTKHLPPVTDEAKILHLGNGNSVNADDPLFSASLTPKQTLPASLSKLGYDGQTAIDFSPVVIAKMTELHPEVRWDVMDIRHLSYPDSSFDVCIDKATLDAMLYGSLWDPEDEIKANVASYVDEVGLPLSRIDWLLSSTGGPSVETWRCMALHHMAATTFHPAAHRKGRCVAAGIGDHHRGCRHV